ncbi:peptidase domain-containing ABC transporter [Magnetospira sp. QH-2]|uniref:peptidase domain-containing ABC transporter n=1 Tax=Magnetospira sp. (strain QH-2) TaxID=1288970 RepID=UPI0003E818D3|nr:ABC transporter transmembrane domain-containing protein [Magnetospira sp. QH-2]CCQ72673.1 Toxin secretion ATP-binding protein [Magnetospira sp. QH-2]
MNEMSETKNQLPVPDFSWAEGSEASLTLSDDQITSGKLGGFKAATDVAACLLPLLKALGWRGNPRHVVEALPHFADTLDLTALLNVMANLGFSSRSTRVRLRHLDSRLMPCLYLPDRGFAQVILGREGKSLSLFDSKGEQYVNNDKPRGGGTVYLFQPLEDDDPRRQAKTEGYVGKMTDRFRPLIYQILAVSFFSNLLVIATPLFIMAVYDKVVATGSMTTLAFLVAGVSIALIGDVVLRGIRSRMIAFIGARLDHIIGNAIFERLLYLAPSFTERATIGAQVARLKDFESIRDFFTGPMAAIALEVPFVFIFVIVMGLLGGTIAFIPLVTLILFIILGLIVLPILRTKVAATSRAESARQEFLVEALGKMRSLKYAGAEPQWRERYKEISARAAMRSYATSKVQAVASTTAHVLIVGSGMATLGWGVTKVLDGDMSVGGLIASMILVWRILGPMQTGFLTMTQIEQVRASVRQIDNLMQLKPERDPNTKIQPLKRFKGAVSFARVSLRYSPDSDPALVGVTFDVNPGELCAVIGPNGCGKSTVLKLVGGMYQPQAGSVRIDNVDIRQIDPIELRHAVAYVPQQCQLFFGTIAQNLRLSNPTASDEELQWACHQAGLLEDINQMPDGFWTRVGDGRSEQLPASMSQKISLARAYLKRASVMLFDEPVNGLDFEGDKQFMRTLESMRGSVTAFLVTHRPSHLALMDKIVILDGGLVRMAGPADQVREKIPPGLF